MRALSSHRLAAGALVALGLLAVVLVYPTSGGVRADESPDAGLSKIQHVVFIVQENRSFNNLFYDYPGADTAKTGKCNTHMSGHVVTYTLHAQTMKTPWDVSHGLQDARDAYDKGAMDGFCNEYADSKPFSNLQYAYVPQNEVAPYWNMAKQYVLADHMFASQMDGSFVAHQYIIAGWAGNTYDLPFDAPWGCDAPAGVVVGVMNARGQPIGFEPPCFTYSTIATELNNKKVSWRTYSPAWPSPTSSPPDLGYYLNGYDAIKQIREGPQWVKNNLHPETKILQDVKNGDLAAVTWVIPSALLSDHAGYNSDRGPSWVTSVVNAIGQSKFWDSTAIFVTWDDWGGWYDPVVPKQLDWDGLGMRVPLLCISPYAKSDYIDHTQYEFGSLLKFLEARFNLSSLGRDDARSAAPMGCFDFSQSPRKFQKIPATYSVQDVLAHVTDIPADNQ
jgi:phospholipase C